MIYTVTVMAFIIGFWIGRASRKNPKKDKYGSNEYFYPHF